MRTGATSRHMAAMGRRGYLAELDRHWSGRGGYAATWCARRGTTSRTRPRPISGPGYDAPRRSGSRCATSARSTRSSPRSRPRWPSRRPSYRLAAARHPGDPAVPLGRGTRHGGHPAAGRAVLRRPGHFVEVVGGPMIVAVVLLVAATGVGNRWFHAGRGIARLTGVRRSARRSDEAGRHRDDRAQRGGRPAAVADAGGLHPGPDERHRGLGAPDPGRLLNRRVGACPPACAPPTRPRWRRRWAGSRRHRSAPTASC